jgi:hypothetical protein
MKLLYRFQWNCGRMGDMSGIFVADSDAVKNAIGSELYFGEVLGKHSEIEGTLVEDDVEVITDDQGFIQRFEELGCSNGFNPLSYLKDFHCEECGEHCGQGRDTTDDNGECATCAEKRKAAK